MCAKYNIFLSREGSGSILVVQVLYDFTLKINKSCCFYDTGE